MAGEAVADEGEVAKVECDFLHIVADNLAVRLRVVGEVGGCGGVDAVAVSYES